MATPDPPVTSFAPSQASPMVKRSSSLIASTITSVSPRLPASAIVGNYADVAERLAALAALGITQFVLTAPSSLEEAYAIGQHVLPRFRALTEGVRAAA